MALATYITGQACRLPGAADVPALRTALFDGRDLVTEIPRDRWAHDIFIHPQPAPVGKSYVFAAGVLDALWDFDPAAFAITPREAAQMDPQQRLLLQVVYEALEDAGLARDRLAGQEVGVYVGASTMTHGTRLAADPMLTDPYMMTGNTLSLVSNRVSYAFDLRGPSLTVDTACSSSLFAFDLAARALERGEVDTAIVAGSNILLDPNHFAGFSAAHMLSPTGRSRPFSAAADGYVRAEGVVAFVLERKDIADLAPRRPRARVLGTATNSDGYTLTAALPSLAGQTDLLTGLYAAAGVDPETLSFVEAHGTGTPVGDPIEATALGRALGAHRSAPLPIGSIKSNIGHLEPASGAAGLLKTLISFDENRYPPTLHAEALNPEIDFGALNLSVVREAIDLEPAAGMALRAGVSSFGFGGANAHVILEKAPVAPAVHPAAPERRSVLLLSAASEAALSRQLAAWADRIGQDAPDDAALADWAGQVAHFRALEPHRAAILCADSAATAESLAKAAQGVGDARAVLGQGTFSGEPTVFVFSGNGSQYAGMGRLAMATDPVYAAKLREIDEIFARLSTWSIIERMESPTLDQELADCDIAQPLLFADQVAQVAALAARGLKPAAVMGHSAGEVAAAHVAGALSLDAALALIYWRSFSQQRLRGTGTMAALQVSAEEAAESLAEFGRDIHIAADNSPRSVTLVGSNEAVADYIRYARRARRWACVKLDIDYPYHSPAQDAILEELAAAISGIRPEETALPFVSTVTGTEQAGSGLGTAYWCANVREPVAFRPAVQKLAQMGFRAYLEIGPSPVLINYLRDSLGPEAPSTAVIAGFEKSDKTDPVGRTIARAAVHGCGLAPGDLAPAPVAFDRSLPKAPWVNQEYRIDRSPAIVRTFGTGDDFHRFLGVEDGADSRTWRADMDLALFPELAAHRVGDQVLFPATAFAETALAAAGRALGTALVELRDLDILAPFRLTDTAMTSLRTSARADGALLRIESIPRGADETQWRLHLRSRFYLPATPPAVSAAPDPARRPGDTDARDVYDAARRIGLDYGPGFRRLSHLRTGAGGAVEVILDPAEPMALGHRGQPTHALDLIGADAVFHGVIGALMQRGDASRSYLPVRIGRLVLIEAGATLGSGRISIRRVGQRSVLADFTLYATDGKPVAVMQGVRFQAAQLHRGLDLDQHAYRFEIEPLDTAETAPGLDLAQALALAGDPGFAPDDPGAFVVEGIVQNLILAAARGLADAQGLVRAPTGGTDTYLRAAMAVLERAGLAGKTAAGWYLVPGEPEATPPGALVAMLVARRPDLGPEAALLARLAAGLGTFLATPPDSARAAFGRDALVNLADGSVTVQRRHRLLHRLAVDLAGRWPGTRALRVAEISDGQARVLPELVDTPALAAAALAEIVVPCRGEAGAAVPLPPERVERIEEPGKPGPFDVVIVPGLFERVEHAAALADRIAALLAPGGTLVAVAEAPGDFSDLVHGLDPDWFTGTDAEGAPLSRAVPSHAAEALLAGAGLVDVGAAALPDGFGNASVIVARAPAATEPGGEAQGQPALASLIEALISGADHPAISERPEAAMRLARPEGTTSSALVYCCPGAGLAAAPEATLGARLLAFAEIAAELADTSAELVAVVPGGTGQPGARAADPLQTATWDALRVAVNEYPTLSRRVIDAADGLDDAQLAAAVARELSRGAGATEVVLGQAARWGLRVTRGLPAPHAAAGAGLDDRFGTALTPPATGGLDDLAWSVVPRRAPGAGEIEIAVTATGLNYRDVMWAMGLLPEEALEKGFAGASLGMEFSGRVARIGAGVEGFAPGDHVVAFGPASFASHKTLSTDFVARLPGGVDLEAAAAIPVAFFTAHYALVHLGQITEGETVLVHGGAGGVGLAAVQIARARGARVIATAGSDVKRDLLAALGVDHVLDSRSLAFADEVMALTEGRGADLVLNALAGEAMEKSLNCLAPFGRFLELGKQDFYANTLVGLRPMKENIAYFGVDVDQLIAARPELSRRLFAEMLDGFEGGGLRPIPTRSFDGGRVIDAFRLMQKSGHVGKIVVRPQPASARPSAAPGRSAVAADGVHVIIGGLGGLGLEVGGWLVAGGARHLALVGRRADPGPGAAAAIDRWRARGVEVTLAACDVADAAALAALLDGLRARGPIRGVIHSAMVLEDMPMSALTPESLARTLPAKVAGAAHLDRLTRADSLDYFVLFSSVAAMIGNHGQSAYAAANGYLEGIARARHDAGLPGLAVGWGAVSDAGYLTREAGQADMIKRATGNVAFTARQVTEALAALLAAGADAGPVHYVSNMRWGALTRSLRTLSEPGWRLMRVLAGREGNDSGGGQFRADLIALPERKAEARLTAFLVERIAKILLVAEGSIKTGQPIETLGMDSLMGVEFGLVLEQALGESVPLSLISETLSIDQISRNIVRHLRSGDADEPADATARLLARHGKTAAKTLSEGDRP